MYGPEHPHTLMARHELAYWTGQAGDPAAARKRLTVGKDVAKSVFDNRAGTVCFAVRGYDRASRRCPRSARLLRPRRRVPYRRPFVAAMAWSAVS